MTRRRLGLEWRGRVLTAVELEEGSDGRRVTGSVRRSWGPEAPVTAGQVRSLLSEGGIAPRRAVLALSGPDVSVKPLWLPPLPDATLATMLRDEGERFFLLPRGARSYGLFAPAAPDGEREAADGERPRWAAAAPAEEVRELLAALEGAGVDVRRVTASEALYPHLARFAGGGSPAPRAVLRLTAEGADRILYRDGAPEDIRRVGPDEIEADLPGPTEEAAPPGGGPLLLLADRGVAPAAAEPVGSDVVRPDPGLPGAGTFAGALAAALAEGEPAAGPDLMPAEVRRARRRWSRRTTAVLAGVVGVLLALAAWLADRRGERREALMDRQVREARAAAAPVVERKAAVARVARQLSAFREAAGDRLPHLRLLTSMTEALPEGAWLVSYVSRDARREALLTGYARSATEALARLSDLPLIESVRFERPTRKVEVADETFESFTLAVTVVPVADVPAPEPDEAGAGDEAGG